MKDTSLPPERQPGRKPVLAPLLVGLFIGAVFIIAGSLYVWLIHKFRLPVGFLIFIIILFATALVLMITVVLQRIHELKEEEEHDFSQY